MGMTVKNQVAILAAVTALIGGIATLVSAVKNGGDQAKTPSLVPSAPPANTTYGNNSPVLGPNSHVEYHTEPQRAPAHVEVLDFRLPRNNEKSVGNDDDFPLAEMDGRIVDIFDKLVALDGHIVYIRFDTYVGAGIGLDDVPDKQAIRAGVIFEAAKLDGFGGNRSGYDYGYTVSLDKYRDQWRRSREATLLFPNQGNAFFDVHYMKSMNFQGMAKIKVSGMQGLLFIEVIPVTPTDDLLLAYNELKKKYGGGVSEF